ncbi:MAG TPA: thioesterase family protein [Candidatus Baltobacteraceae bacterium]|nr:thioesterase family protein [Candidatus Baltobacteraceae bacterium]
MPQFRDSLPEGTRVFESRLQVQWADVDIAGIMYFANYWRFAEYAEMEMFRELGLPFDSLFDDLDFWLPRVRAEADYYAPALMGDWIRMRAHLEKVGASSVRFRIVMFNERTGIPMASLVLTVAAMDRRTKKSMPLPARVRDVLLTCLPARGESG